MKFASSVSPAALLGFLLVQTVCGHAQVVATHAPDGGTRETLQSISVSSKTGAPFSATVATDWTRMLEDETTTTIHNVRLIARDSSGRVFQERRFLTATGDKVQTPLSALEYYDPVRNEFLNCNPAAKVCLKGKYKPPPQGPEQLPATVVLGNNSLTREDLGSKTIANLETVGSRQIVAVVPGANGYTKTEHVVKEFWYSPFLDLNLVVQRFEPRGGAENFRLENINLGEPDPRLFTPPADYKIVELFPG